jgi:anti-sigma factor RsiW
MKANGNNMAEKTHYSEELQDLLTGRLDEDQRLTVEQHLQTCDQCRKELEALRWTRRLLSKIPDTEAPSGLREKIVHSLDKEDRKSGKWKKYLPYAAALVLVLLAALYFLRPDVASSVAKDFRDFRSGKLSLQIYTTEENEMETFFRTHGINFPTRVFDLAMMKYDLFGGRVHQLNRRKSAFFVYKSEANQFLVCQMYPGIASDLPKGATLREHNGIKFYIYERQGLTTVFWQEGEVLCVLVSDISSQQVIELAFAKAMLAPEV